MNETLVNPEVPDRVINLYPTLEQVMHVINQSPRLGRLIYTLLKIKYRN